MIEWLGLGEMALGMVESCQVVEASGHVRVLWSQGLFNDCQCTLVERLGLGVMALSLVELRQVVEVSGQVGMVWTKSLLGDGKSSSGRPCPRGSCLCFDGKKPGKTDGDGECLCQRRHGHLTNLA